MEPLEKTTDPSPQSSSATIAELNQTIRNLRAELATYKETGAQISRFANQLRTAADVSKHLSSILDLDHLLNEVVGLLRDRFQLYHVHAYLLNEADHILRMVAGSGSVGEQLRAASHGIPLSTEHSLVARAAREGYIILVDDVFVEPDFLPNPLLPHTRSEMAIPLIIGQRVLGVLDVQDDQSHRFDQLDVATFSAFSGHIASAIQNAHLFAQQKEAEQIQRRYAERLKSLHAIDQAILTAQSPQSIACSAIQRLRPIVAYCGASFAIFDFAAEEAHIVPVVDNGVNMPLMGQYSLRGHSALLATLKDGPLIGSPADLSHEIKFLEPLVGSQVESILVYPLLADNELIGTINLSRCQTAVFEEVDINMVGEMAAPLAIAIKQARLYEQVQRHAQVLEEQNAELEQFAYVASHDLQEPLRIVISYVQLLARRYEGKLDEDADIFLNYIVDGATRMKDLINDLLDYSRLGRSSQAFAPTGFDQILDEVLADLHVTIAERRARVRRDPLPTLPADARQLRQLWQNLLSNALKFSPEAPDIYIGAREEKGEWLFWVQDQGIGLEEAYAERIFAIFQRLHTIEEYPGTGIGLAICKRIVERHNGRLWVKSQPGSGATFFFTIPDKSGKDKSL